MIEKYLLLKDLINFNHKKYLYNPHIIINYNEFNLSSCIDYIKYDDLKRIYNLNYSNNYNDKKNFKIKNIIKLDSCEDREFMFYNLLFLIFHIYFNMINKNEEFNNIIKSNILKYKIIIGFNEFYENADELILKNKILKDIINLDLDLIIKFNDDEIIYYIDCSKQSNDNNSFNYNKLKNISNFGDNKDIEDKNEDKDDKNNKNNDEIIVNAKLLHTLIICA